MVAVAGHLILAAVLVGASVAKLASPRSSSAALATFGIRPPAARWGAWAALVATELVLAAGVAAGIDLAAYLAAGLMAGFGVAMLGAVRVGRSGAPCACFGARSTVSRAAVARNLALSFAYVSLPLLPEGDLSTDQWLTLGLILALLACAGLAVAVLALAREVGMLRLRLGPAAALEIPEEGPALGARTGVVERLHPGGSAELALAVFVSDGCHVCKGLEPAIASLERDPLLAVETFEEEADAELWRDLEVPGSPYAVALDLEGTVLAKGPSTTSPSSKASSRPPSVAAPCGPAWSPPVSEPIHDSGEVKLDRDARPAPAPDQGLRRGALLCYAFPYAYPYGWWLVAGQMPRVVTSEDLRARLGRELDTLREGEEELYVSKRGRLSGVLLDVDRYSELLDRLEYLEDSLAALQAREEPDATVPWSEVRE